MKTKVLTLLLFLSFLNFSNTFSQTEFNTNNLLVTSFELNSKTYNKDPSADALVIYEEGNSYIDRENGNLITEIKRKIKIFTAKGFNHATVMIPVYDYKSRKQKVKYIKGETTNSDGKSQLTKENIFIENYSEKYNLIKFTFPNVQEGSVISYSYTIESPFLSKYYGWEFQSSIPKLKSIYHTSIPANYEYNIRLVGGLKINHQTSKIQPDCFGGSAASAGCTLTNYIMEDIPAFHKEQFITAEENYLSKIDYELKTIRHFDGRVDEITKSWKAADKEIRTDIFANQMFKSGIAKSQLEHISISSSQIETAKSIYEYVQNNFTWNKKHSIYQSSDLKKLIKEKLGNATVINLLLCNMLSEAGIDVKPVLMSTRANGKPTRLYPIISDFNYLIVRAKIDDKFFLLDATDHALFFGELPLKCLNYMGREFPEKGASQWIEIHPGGYSNIQQSANIVLNEDENLLDVKFNSTTMGYHSINKRKAYFSNPGSYKDQINLNNPSLEFVDHKLISGAINASKFEEEFNFTSGFDNISGRLYINPFVAIMFDNNPLKYQERTYPIEFGFKDTYIYKARIILDNTYTVAEIPEDLTYSLPNNSGTLILKYIKKEDEIQVFFRFNFSMENYPSNYYQHLKSYFAKIIDIQKNSIIILEKKIN